MLPLYTQGSRSGSHSFYTQESIAKLHKLLPLVQLRRQQPKNQLFFRFVTHAKLHPKLFEPDAGAPLLHTTPAGAKIQITLPKSYLEIAKETALPVFFPSGGTVDVEQVMSDLKAIGATIEDKQTHRDHYLAFKMKQTAQIPEDGFRYFAHVYGVVDDTAENIIKAKQYYSNLDYIINEKHIPKPLRDLITKSVLQELETPKFLDQAARYFDNYQYTMNDDEVYLAYQRFYTFDDPARNLVDAFFDIKKADCDIFNGVYARILRGVAHLPTVMVLGYTSSYQPETGRGLISLGNYFHEWTEVLLRTKVGKHIWVPLDATSTWDGGDKKTAQSWLPAPEAVDYVKGVEFEKPGSSPLYVRLKEGWVPFNQVALNDARNDGAIAVTCAEGEQGITCRVAAQDNDSAIWQRYLKTLE